ncbi:MAG TPA: glycoside hydrolase family 32 protein [Saprospiraceae bacterium]|nr:glycoside hydrolase family 32 protein [Saprospiraceae bacterium]
MKPFIICLPFALMTLIACGRLAPQVVGEQKEAHRPIYHFTPDSMWMNDPNGMVYYEGEYHLFFQHHPDSTVWGPMHWGHAVSEDLVHWEQLPIALYPDEQGMIFSGSAVIDWQNTSGLGSEKQPAMVAIFTYHDMEGEQAGANDFQTQGIAYSLDKGRSWTKYADNPVLDNPGMPDFRDPKVFWHQPTQKWIMIFAAGDHIRLYHSPNLIYWTFASEFRGWGNEGRPWECPDLFPLTLEGSDITQWVMLVSIGKGAPNGGSGTQYFVGDFDGNTFTLNPQFQEGLKQDSAYWVDWGKDNYAGVTWSDIPKEDGRRLFIGWMSNWQYANVVPTEKWRSAMTIPRELKLISTKGGARLSSKPVEELDALRSDSASIADRQTLKNATGELVLSFDLKENQDEIVGFTLGNGLNEKLRIGFDPEANAFFVDRREAGKTGFSEAFAGRHTAPRRSDEGQLYLHAYIDRASVELFADDGKTVLTEIFFPNEDFTELEILGMEYLEDGMVYDLHIGPQSHNSQ